MSALVAAIPIAVLFVMLGVQRKPTWMAALTALAIAFVLALRAAALLLPVSPRQFVGVYRATFGQLAKSMLTIASMLALAYLMNCSGMTSTLGIALAATGSTFPFLGAILGWLGVFLVPVLPPK